MVFKKGQPKPKNAYSFQKGHPFYEGGQTFQKGHSFYGDLTKPNYFKKGQIPWNKGKHLIHSGSFKKGHEVPQEWRDKIYKALFKENKHTRTGRTRNCRYLEWRNKVFENDDFICQKCEQKGGRLQAHHKNSWSEYLELGYDVNNGITFCEECHRKFHKKYGYRTSAKQCREFVEEDDYCYEKEKCVIYCEEELKCTF